MWPIGPLMHEHRLIERMIALMDREIRNMTAGAPPDHVFLDSAVDFIRTYADQCHHGKEEDILFRDLALKPLGHDLAAIMDQLIEEHRVGRRLVQSLVEAQKRHLEGIPEAGKDIVEMLHKLIEFYPKHIFKEDKHFFFPCMDAFTESEKESMLSEMWEFDRMMIHKKYEGMVSAFEHAR